jgi:hypothetical protein
MTQGALYRECAPRTGASFDRKVWDSRMPGGLLRSTGIPHASTMCPEGEYSPQLALGKIEDPTVGCMRLLGT